jgi:N-methylhydantoinase A
VQELSAGSAKDLGPAFEALETGARAALDKEGFDNTDISFERFLDLKYAGQQWPVKVSVLDIWRNAEAVRARFESEFGRLFGYTQPDGKIRIDNLRVTATGALPEVGLQGAGSRGGRPEPSGYRDVYIDRTRGRENLAIYDGDRLQSGHRIAGPALVEEQTTTVMIGPDDVLDVDPYRNYTIRLDRTGVAGNA